MKTEAGGFDADAPWSVSEDVTPVVVFEELICTDGKEVEGVVLDEV